MSEQPVTGEQTQSDLTGVLEKVEKLLSPEDFGVLIDEILGPKKHRALFRAKGFLNRKDYLALVVATRGRVIAETNAGTIEGTLPFESGIIESNTGNVQLAIQKPQEEKPGLMYIEVNTGFTQLLVEDPGVIIKAVLFSREELSIFGNPPENPARTIYVESNSTKGVEMHYPDSPQREETKMKIPTKPLMGEHRSEMKF